jgi:hypothetical protein
MIRNDMIANIMRSRPLLIPTPMPIRILVVSWELRLASLLLSGAGDAEVRPEGENTRAEGMTVRRLVAVGVVRGAEVSTILVDEENEEISDESNGIDVEDDDEADIEAVADAELGLEFPIVVGKKILFFVPQQS